MVVKILECQAYYCFCLINNWFVKHYIYETTANRKTYIHVGLLGHNILIKSQPIFEVTPKCCVVTKKPNCIVLVTPERSTPIRGEHANQYTLSQ